MRRKIIIFIFTLSILLIGLISLDHNFSRSYHHTFTKSTDLSKENVDGMYLGDDIKSEKIVAKYGEISELSQDNVLYNYYLLSDKIEIATNLDDSKIIRFIVEDKTVGTEKGVKTRDKKDKIIELYGDNYYTRLEQGTNIIGYVDKNKKCSIEFWLVDDEVVFY
ncbi:hypothetical protein CHL78_019970, partial [Romboutsia weinsteinii]